LMPAKGGVEGKSRRHNSAEVAKALGGGGGGKKGEKKREKKREWFFLLEEEWRKLGRREEGTWPTRISIKALLRRAGLQGGHEWIRKERERNNTYLV